MLHPFPIEVKKTFSPATLPPITDPSKDNSGMKGPGADSPLIILCGECEYIDSILLHELSSVPRFDMSLEDLPEIEILTTSK